MWHHFALYPLSTCPKCPNEPSTPRHTPEPKGPRPAAPPYAQLSHEYDGCAQLHFGQQWIDRLNSFQKRKTSETHQASTLIQDAGQETGGLHAQRSSIYFDEFPGKLEYRFVCSRQRSSQDIDQLVLLT